MNVNKFPRRIPEKSCPRIPCWSCQEVKRMRREEQVGNIWGAGGTQLHHHGVLGEADDVPWSQKFTHLSHHQRSLRCRALLITSQNKKKDPRIGMVDKRRQKIAPMTNSPCQSQRKDFHMVDVLPQEGCADSGCDKNKWPWTKAWIPTEPVWVFD